MIFAKKYVGWSVGAIRGHLGFVACSHLQPTFGASHGIGIGSEGIRDRPERGYKRSFRGSNETFSKQAETQEGSVM